jgi:hypothetical protein
VANPWLQAEPEPALLVADGAAVLPVAADEVPGEVPGEVLAGGVTGTVAAAGGS